MKKISILLVMLAIGLPCLYADDYNNDDIYYNPKKEKKIAVNKQKSNYIADFSNIDPDEYNRRGQYYLTPIDTIGSFVENGEDFIYTQQIQKFYNPTIVIDNSNLLADVLNNSYGNINVIYEGGYPYFLPIYSNVYPYYRNPWIWGSGWNLGWNLGWNISWNIGWYDPWYAWNYPVYGSPWYWNWGPSWGWGPGWRPVPVRPIRPYYADYRPGNHTVGARPGWTGSTRPSVRPSGVSRPGVTTRPTVSGNHTAGTRPGVSSRPSVTTRPGVLNKPQTSITRPSQSSNPTPAVSNGGTKRGGYNSGSSTQRNSSNNSNKNSYNRNTTTNNSNSYNRNSNNSGSMRGGYNGGGRSSGGYSGGSRGNAGRTGGRR